MLRVLRSRNVWSRSAGLWFLGLSILFIVWILSFRSLPEGVVHGKTVVYYVSIETEDLFSTFVRIFLWNLVVGCVPIVIASLVQIKGFSLGYILPFYHWAMYGILLGTNSFKIPGLNRLFPSLLTLFSGIGIYEITAYSLIASAAYSLSILTEEGLSENKAVKGDKWSQLRLSKSELGVMIFAVLLLAISNYFEASNASLG